MTKQITVRIPDEDLEFVDQMVADGRGSRASLISKAIAAERRRERARIDARIYAASRDNDDMDSLAEFAASTAPDVD